MLFCLHICACVYTILVPLLTCTSAHLWSQWAQQSTALVCPSATFLSWRTLHKQPTRGGFRSELVLLVYSTTGTFNLILFTTFVFQNITYACRDKHKIGMGFCCCFCLSPAELLFSVSSTPSGRQTRLSLICQQLLICCLTGWRGTRWLCVCIANSCRVHQIVDMCFSIAIFGRLKERQQKGEEVMQCEESSHLWLVLSVIRRKGKWNGPLCCLYLSCFCSGRLFSLPTQAREGSNTARRVMS